MLVCKLKDMTRGWFIGGFKPSAYSTKDFEVAIKEYRAGDYEEFHHHRKATEITTIIRGSAEMNGKVYKSGDIIIIEPKEGTDFKAITDVTNIVIKKPSVENDKFIGQYKE